MLAFIDESGCPGFKLTRGSDAVFAIGMVVFENSDDAGRTAASIAQFRMRTAHRHELKFARSSDRVRDDFFASISGCPFKLRALIVEKDRIRDAVLREHRDDFYDLFVRALVRRAAYRLQDVRLSIDGSGSRDFRRAMKRRLRNDLAGRLLDLRFLDSQRDDSIQLADMCVGAVARAFGPHPEGDRWLRMLAPRVEEIWRFP